MNGPPPNLRRGRQRHLARGLEVATWLVVALVVGALVAPEPLDRQLGWAAILVLAVSPLVRVTWLAVRWTRLGDRRFAVAAVALFLVVLTGALVP